MANRRNRKTWSIRTAHNLECQWCNHINDLQDIEDMFRAFPDKTSLHYTCSKCARKSRVNVSVKGFYSLYPADRMRYLRNVEKGTERLITLADYI
jgi:hypothetical protein